MMVKTFHGRTSSDAFASIRAAFGPDAAILETRKGQNGIEVVAAIERPRASAGQKGSRRPSRSESVPATAPLATASGIESNGDWICDTLADQGFTHFLAGRIASAARANLDHEQLLDRRRVISYARLLVEAWIRTAPDKAGTGPKVRVFIGPSGVGKTTTAAKLAASEALSRSRKVVLASADDRRLGGAEQLEAFARVLGVRFHVVSNGRQFDHARADAGSEGTLLLDTPGIKRGDRRAMDRLAEIVTRVEPEEISLLLAADHDAATLTDTVQRFRPLRPGVLMTTRCDEAIRRGAVVSALARARLPVSHVTDGPDIPDDIEIADSRRLAEWALPLPEETQ